MDLKSERQLLRLEFAEPSIGQTGKIRNELETVEFEILSPSVYNENQKTHFANELFDIDENLNGINEKINELNSKIDSLTNHADGLDYIVAIGSGMLAGIIDSVWVGEFSIDRANEWGNERVEDFVVKIAQGKGYEGDDLAGAVQFLEQQFPIAADKATNDFGGGLQHHLRDFSHHPTPVGLFFSLLTQFTGNAYGTGVEGNFKVIPLNEDGLALVGKNFSEKITFGVINWFFHMVSDMAGSSTSIKAGKVGTGLPGPIGSLLKEASALPIFNNMNEKGYKDFSVWVSKLFNGTLLGERDETGKLTEAVKFDLRTEIGGTRELGRQSVPVIINECIVRGFYFIRRLLAELKEHRIEKIADLKNLNWKNTLPFKNRTVCRMLTVSSGVFVAFDVVDAAIRSGGFNAACILRINYVGVGRFAIAVGSDISMGIRKSKRENERLILRAEQLELLNAKLFYKTADMWIEAQNTERALQELYCAVERSAFEFEETWQEIESGSEERKRSVDKMIENNKDLADEISELLEWGI